MLLLSKICLMALCLIFCSLSVYAVTDNVPKTINLQGRYTRNYGDPIANTQMRVYFQVKKGSNWESVQGSPFSTTTDSEGLYNLNAIFTYEASDQCISIFPLFPRRYFLVCSEYVCSETL